MKLKKMVQIQNHTVPSCEVLPVYSANILNKKSIVITTCNTCSIANMEATLKIYAKSVV